MEYFVTNCGIKTPKFEDEKRKSKMYYLRRFASTNFRTSFGIFSRYRSLFELI